LIKDKKGDELEMKKINSKLVKDNTSTKQKTSSPLKTIIVPSNGVSQKSYSSSAKPNLSKLQRVPIT